jgi:hypothetical protein
MRMLQQHNGAGAERKLGGKAEAMPHEQNWGFITLRGPQTHPRQDGLRRISLFRRKT